MRLTDELIEATADSITGFIVAKLADREGRPIDEVLEDFMTSQTGAALHDQQTGLYWDSIPATIELYLAERQSS